VTNANKIKDWARNPRIAGLLLLTLGGGDCPAEKVPEGFSSIGAQYSHDPFTRVIIFVMENLQQTAEQVRVNTGVIRQVICSALGRHPVKIDW
jgi:hypothetical protein